MMMNEYLIEAGENDQGKRLDVFLTEYFIISLESEQQISRNGLQKLISRGSVKINGIIAEKNLRLKSNDIIVVTLPDIKKTSISPEDIPLDIVYEDEDIIVVLKPKGMVVHPSAGHDSNTLVNALLFHCGESLSGINGESRPGIVHRIDKDTSGLLVVAKNNTSHISLAKQLADHSMERRYHAVCHGRLKNEAGRIDYPIGRDRKDRKKFAVDYKNGKTAATNYFLVENLNKYCHLKLELETGRTHQIRVHMTSIGHPVAGDILYGPKSTPKELFGQCLHAKTLGFIHPRTGEKMYFNSDLPDYFCSFIKSKQEGNAE